jgi:hypothetical protein
VLWREQKSEWAVSRLLLPSQDFSFFPFSGSAVNLLKLPRVHWNWKEKTPLTQRRNSLGECRFARETAVLAFSMHQGLLP